MSTTGEIDLDFSGLRATFVNGTLKRSPEPSHTEGLVEASAAIMRAHGVEVDVIRAVDHDIATGVYPDMREHGWEGDAWPDLLPGILASDILVIAGPIWLGDNSSVTKRVIERLYAMSGELNDKGQYLFYGRVAGCLLTGNEDGIKHCAMNILYSLQHLGYTIPPNADAGWIGEAGPGPSYLDEGSGGPGQRLHQPQHDLHDVEPPAPRPDAARRRRRAGPRQPAVGVERGRPLRLGEPGVPMSGALLGEDGVARCPWAGTSAGVMRDYHDVEWGRRVHGEAAYLERLTLEAFQSGLSWSTILHKREAFREVFCGFDADLVAAFGQGDHARLMADARIVRNRLKVSATITNARATVALRDHEGLEALILSFAPEVAPAPTDTATMATTSAESTALSKELKRRGFVFVGPTTMYALMEAIGIFDPHLVGCHARGSTTTSR